jgi:hypothetical protein
MLVETVIYEPPKPELPYLVVTVAPSGVDVVTAANRTEARTMVAQRTRRKPQKTSNGTSRSDPG